MGNRERPLIPRAVCGEQAGGPEVEHLGGQATQDLDDGFARYCCVTRAPHEPRIREAVRAGRGERGGVEAVSGVREPEVAEERRWVRDPAPVDHYGRDAVTVPRADGGRRVPGDAVADHHARHASGDVSGERLLIKHMGQRRMELQLYGRTRHWATSCAIAARSPAPMRRSSSGAESTAPEGQTLSRRCCAWGRLSTLRTTRNTSPGR